MRTRIHIAPEKQSGLKNMNNMWMMTTTPNGNNNIRQWMMTNSQKEKSMIKWMSYQPWMMTQRGAEGKWRIQFRQDGMWKFGRWMKPCMLHGERSMNRKQRTSMMRMMMRNKNMKMMGQNKKMKPMKIRWMMRGDWNKQAKWDKDFMYRARGVPQKEESEP